MLYNNTITTKVTLMEDKKLKELAFNYFSQEFPDANFTKKLAYISILVLAKNADIAPLEYMECLQNRITIRNKGIPCTNNINTN